MFSIPQSSALQHPPSIAVYWWGQRSEPPHSAGLSSRQPPDLCCHSDTGAAGPKDTGRSVTAEWLSSLYVSAPQLAPCCPAVREHTPTASSRGATDLYGVQGDVGPVQAVAVIIKVQSHSLPEASQRQSLVSARGQVVAMDGVPHSVQDELITLCKTTGDSLKTNTGTTNVHWHRAALQRTWTTDTNRLAASCRVNSFINLKTWSLWFIQHSRHVVIHPVRNGPAAVTSQSRSIIETLLLTHTQ